MIHCTKKGRKMKSEIFRSKPDDCFALIVIIYFTNFCLSAMRFIRSCSASAASRVSFSKFLSSIIFLIFFRLLNLFRFLLSDDKSSESSESDATLLIRFSFFFGFLQKKKSFSFLFRTFHSIKINLIHLLFFTAAIIFVASFSFL